MNTIATDKVVMAIKSKGPQAEIDYVSDTDLATQLRTFIGGLKLLEIHMIEP